MFDGYFFEKNLQGDVVGIWNQNGTKVVTYTYDAWGNITVSGTGASTIGAINPIRYRSYYYDTETGFYYLQSRYYNPVWGRFLNADGIAYLGADGALIGYNLFIYCGNNPVMGYDPAGTWNWGGFILGLGIVAATVITVATFGVGSAAGAMVAMAAIATGTTMMAAAATDSTLVIDVSASLSDGKETVSAGLSLVIDFDSGGVELYGHVGVAGGNSTGITYSTGIVSNYDGYGSYGELFAQGGVSFLGLELIIALTQTPANTKMLFKQQR